MEFDRTHDVQQVYRKLLTCMSRPGIIENLSSESQKIDINIAVSRHVLAILFTVLDGEVSFSLMPESAHDLTKRLNHLTYAKNDAPSEADYIIITKEAENYAKAAIAAAKTGTLSNPHKSATVIIETQKISAGSELALSGPGIEKEKSICISGCADWLEARREKNVEFPLGVDIIIVDESGNIISLPRTTRLVYKGVH